MRHQRMMTWVSIAGTAMAIFLVMTYFMVDQLGTVEVTPETHRSKMLYGGGLEIQGEQLSMNSTMSYHTAEKIFGNLDGIARMTYTSAGAFTGNIGEKGKLSRAAAYLKTDADFWKVYDFRFIAGKPYDEADCRSGNSKVVITRGVARKIFKKDDPVGETLQVNGKPFVVCGVVEDVNPSLDATFSNIYIPFTPEDYDEQGEYGLGEMMVHLMMDGEVSHQGIKDQVKTRYDRLSAELAKDSMTAVYHEAPFNAETYATGWAFSNVTPDLTKQHRTRFLIYTLLLLVPAINLGSMMRGRLRHRVSEIGVCRAFGAKRSAILRQILGENLIITLIGGAIGLLCSYLFMTLASSQFFRIGYVSLAALQFVSATPEIKMLFTWDSFMFVLASCFVLNLLSAFVPAWKASRLAPAEAISKSKI